MDLDLPVMSGIEAIERIMSRQPHADPRLQRVRGRGQQRERPGGARRRSRRRAWPSLDRTTPAPSTSTPPCLRRKLRVAGPRPRHHPPARAAAHAGHGRRGSLPGGGVRRPLTAAAPAPLEPAPPRQVALVAIGASPAARRRC
jgi:chemotaxis response regulator CheB